MHRVIELRKWVASVAQNCVRPSLQGLARYKQKIPLDADYIVVEIAKHILGSGLAPALRRHGQ